MSDAEKLRGSRPRALPRPSATYAPGRVCAAEGCETRLSIYNRARHCWAHFPLRFPPIRAGRRRETVG